MDFKNFIELEIGDDIRHLWTKKRDEYQFAIAEQAIYKLGAIVPVVKKDGTFIFLAKITKVSSTLSEQGNIMTRVTFERVTVNASDNAIREVVNAWYRGQTVAFDDHTLGSMNMVGDMSDDAIRRIAHGQPLGNTNARSTASGSRTYSRKSNLFSIPDDGDDDDAWGPSSLADLTRRMNNR